METAGEYRAEAERLRDLMEETRNPTALKAIQDLIDEMEARARELEDGV